MKKIKHAILTALALAATLGVSRAQPLTPNATTSVRIPFTDISTGSTDFASPSDPTFGVNLSLSNYNRFHVLTNLHGIYGSGTSGLHVALDLTTNGDFATPGGEGSSLGTGPALLATNSLLAFGAINSFTASIWINPKNAANSSTTEIRLFILGIGGDKNNAANCSMFWQNISQLEGNIGATALPGPVPTFSTTDSPGTFPTNQWLFQCLTWDGTTGTLYVGTDGGGTPQAVATVPDAVVINMTGANDILQIGNRDSDFARSFQGSIDDFRFYGSTAPTTGAATANQVEDIYWSAVAPTGIAGTVVNNHVNLSWNALANAATYIVSRASTTGGPYAQLAAGLTSPSYTDTTASYGSTYYYVVQAVDGTADLTTTPDSYEYSFTVVAAPTQPVVTPTAGSDQVVLNWTASTGTPGPITYNVARSTTSGAEVTIATGITSATYTDTTVVSEIPYYYVVTAFNDGLATATTASSEVSVTPVGPPPAPIGVAVAADETGQALVSWADMGSTSYNVLRATSQAGPYTVLASGITTTNYLDTTVGTGTLYYYEVVAMNALSLSSPASSPSGPLGVGQGNQLANPGFELSPLAVGWTRTYGTGATGGALNAVMVGTATYYNAGTCPADNPAELIVSHSGVVTGNSYNYGTAGSVGTWSQTIGATAGSTWQASSWTLASHEDLSGNNIFYYEVDFVDLGGNLLAAYESFVINHLVCGGPNPLFPLDTWVSLGVTNQMTVRGGTNSGIVSGSIGASGIMTAPPGTASVIFAAKFQDVGSAGGSIWFDDCDLDLIAGPVAPTITSIPTTINGTILCTNQTIVVTASSLSGVITNAQAIITTNGLTGTTNTFTNSLNATTSGLGTATATITNILITNLVYNIKIVATDNNGINAATSASFDTMAPLLVIEAEDFNYNGGQFIDTPASGGLALYATVPLSVSEVDYQKALGSGSQAADGSYYRNGDVIINGVAAPANGTAQKYVLAAASGDTTDVPLEVGYNSVNDFLDYSRTFGAGTPGTSVSAPAGTYTVWSRLATVGSGTALNFYQITSDPTQANQSSNLLGTFSFTDNGWNTFDYVPLLDSYGNLVSVSLSGVETLRSTVVGNPNIDFYMLMPSTPVLTPRFAFFYPDGTHPFQPTNHLTFTVGPANGAPIASSGIHLMLNGVDVTAGVTLTPSGNSWIGNYPIASNQVYAAIITVTNTALLSTINTINFDTFNPNNFQWEAVDYDFSTNNGSIWISGLFIDNPVPTCDVSAPQKGTLATNSYFAYPTGFTPGVDPAGLGAVAQQMIDLNFGNSGQSMTSEYYRADGVGSQPAADYVRSKFTAEQTALADPNIGPINLGYYAAGYWLNYSRHYPTNTFNVWGRIAGVAPLTGTTLSQVTSGVGTLNQTTVTLGSFSDPNAAGYQAWHWIPLLDGNGNKVVVPLNGLTTLRVTSGNNINAEFYMLVPAAIPPQLTAALVGGQVQISIPTQSGYNYTLMTASSLTNPSWTPVGTAFPGDGTVHNVSVAHSNPAAFYQVTAQ